MQFAAGTFASESLGSVMVDPGGIVDPTSLRPILTEINGVDARDVVAMNTLKIQDTVGQPVTANFTIVNPSTAPVVGDRVRIFYHSQLIFAGTLDHVRKVSPDRLPRLVPDIDSPQAPAELHQRADPEHHRLDSG
jgi:hypothetical protein